MKSYLEIRILPDPEFGSDMLMAVLFAKLHRMLGQYAAGQIGVSFPGYGKTVGDIIRLHGSFGMLTELCRIPWLRGLTEHVDVSEVRPVPANTQYCCFSRVQIKSNAERLRRRSVKKGWLTEEEALVRIPDSASKKSSLPYIRIKSLSTGETFRLFIRRGPVCVEPMTGDFGTYGLSSTATIPWF